VSTPTTMLRPALEAAVQVARAGEAATPAQPAPQALKRFLNFARLPIPALDVARRVLDEDDGFRQRVAAAVGQADVGEAGWLWLTRPEGWEARVDELRKRMQDLEHHEREERTERDAQRRLTFAEDRARRAEATLTQRERATAEARADADRERAGRQRAVAEVAELRAQIEAQRDERNAAVRQLKEVEGELARKTAELRHARHEIRQREAELELLPSSPPVVSAPEPVRAVESGPERVQLAQTIAKAASAAEQLSEALAAAASLIGAPAGVVPVPAPSPATRVASAPMRAPVRLPPGVLDDSVEAADHLLRTPGALLLVDGYNVSQAAWFGRPITEQRSRLVDALAELHARTGVEVDVVFDGAEHDRVAATAARPAVRVRFSPASVEADDVVLELVARARLDRPVIVASSDNRVRDGARRQGANVVSARQLLGALRR
jgi:predicted RNA-binding protein with PIN domain